MKYSIGAGGILLLSLSLTAGDFVNLGFDDPNLVNLSYYNLPIPGGRRIYGPAQELLNGWTVTEGGKPYSGLMAYAVGQDGGLSYSGIQMALSVGNFTIGKYNIEFQSIRPPDRPGLDPLDMTISQVGTVPVDAYYLIGVGRAIASINGNRLAETRPNDFLVPYWDVHEYAGKEVALSFTFHGGGDGSSTSLDIIGFTAPESSTWALLAVGGLVLGIGFLPRKR